MKEGGDESSARTSRESERTQLDRAELAGEGVCACQGHAWMTLLSRPGLQKIKAGKSVLFDLFRTLLSRD